MRRKIFFCIIFLCVGKIKGELRAPTSLIDIPTAYMLDMPFMIGVNYTLPMGPDTTYIGEINGYCGIEVMDRFCFGASFFSRKIVVFNCKVNLFKENNKYPAISIGSEYLTPHKYISPIGIGEHCGWPDDLLYKPRNSEQFSYFLVATKDLGTYGRYTLGIGRGVFVGYGPLSRGFNTDIFTQTYNNNALGIFWGVEFSIFPPICLLIDFDGRDLNIGGKVKFPEFEIGIAIAKFEHRLKKGEKNSIYSRTALGFATNYLFVKKLLKKEVGTLIIEVRAGTKKVEKRAIITFPGSVFPPLMTDKVTGRCSIQLPPGIYWVRASIPGYSWQDKRIHVQGGEAVLCYFELKRLGSE
jgi:hypothetical protein